MIDEEPDDPEMPPLFSDSDDDDVELPPLVESHSDDDSNNYDDDDSDLDSDDIPDLISSSSSDSQNTNEDEEDSDEYLGVINHEGEECARNFLWTDDAKTLSLTGNEDYQNLRGFTPSCGSRCDGLFCKTPITDIAKWIEEQSSNLRGEISHLQTVDISAMPVSSCMDILSGDTATEQWTQHAV